MPEYLLFQLHGPLAAWGGVAVGEIRPSAPAPTRSGVFGVLAAAQGIRRGDEQALAALCDGYGLAVRVDAPGEHLVDYHTIQVPKAKGKREFFSRRDELFQKLEPGEELTTILSRREYLMNGLFTVCLWLATEPPYPLVALAEALALPRFTPYLGRKSCPPALPLNPVIVASGNPAEAFATYRLAPEGRVLCSKKRKRVDVYTDLPAPWLEVREEQVARDVCAHFGRRQFGLRRVGVGQLPAARFREDAPCS